MYLVTGTEMKEIEKITYEKYKVPPEILMENAGLNVVMALQKEFGSLFFKRVSIFCGGGNNGGDGFVIARHLLSEGASCIIFFTGEKEKLSPEAFKNYEMAEKYGISIIQIKTMGDLEKYKYEIIESDIILDALIGTGLKKNVEGFMASLIAFINTLHKYTVSVDIPSGVDADTGDIKGVAVYADLTVTFGLPKVGITIFPGLECVGKLVCADINFPPNLLSQPRKSILITEEIVKPMLPVRQQNANKGHFGPVLIVGGSRGLDGAVTLTAKAALRTGAGIVNLCIPEGLYNSVKSRSAETIVTPMEEKNGFLSKKNIDKIMKLSEKAKVVVIGPGIGRDKETQELVCELVEKIEKPLVIDADGINAVSEDKKCLKNLTKDVILTPHIGEMSRLTGFKIEEIIKDKIGICRDFKEEYKINVLLKDGRSLVLDTSNNLYINSNGNSGMATPGSGDVLTGIIAALMAHGLLSVHAGIVANFIHGLAGDLLLEEISEEGIIASDLIEYIPKAIKKLKK